MATSLKDIARKAGISINAVSEILNLGRSHLYKRETVERVRAFATKLKYRRSQVIGYVSWSYSEGMLLSHTVFPFLVGMSHGLIKEDYHVALVEIEELQSCLTKQEPDILKNNFFDGLVIHHSFSPKELPWLFELGCPLLFWDTDRASSHISLRRDEREVGAMATRRLIERGHRRILFRIGSTFQRHYLEWQSHTSAFWQEGSGHYSEYERFDGYSEEMKAHRLTPRLSPARTVAACEAELKSTRATGVIIRGLFDHEIWTAAGRLGLRIPEDLSVVSCDIEPRVPSRVRVSGVLYDRYAVGRLAASMMLKMVANPEQKVKSVVFSGDFDMGETLVPPPRKK